MKNKSSEIPKKKCRRTLRLSISLSSLANLAMWSLGRHRNRALEIQRPLVFRRILLRPLWDDRVLAYVSHEQQSWRYMAISYIYIYYIIYNIIWWIFLGGFHTENRKHLCFPACWVFPSGAPSNWQRKQAYGSELVATCISESSSEYWVAGVLNYIVCLKNAAKLTAFLDGFLSCVWLMYIYICIYVCIYIYIERVESKSKSCPNLSKSRLFGWISMSLSHGQCT